LSAFNTISIYFIDIKKVRDQKIRERTPKILWLVTGREEGLSKHILSAYRQLVPKSPYTTPRTAIIRPKEVFGVEESVGDSIKLKII
jgi:hypothetical protein